MSINPITPLKALIRSELNKLGVVDGIHGRVVDTVEPPAVTSGRHWFVVQAPGSRPRDILATAASLGTSPFTVPIVNGVAVFEGHNAVPDEGPVLLYAGVVPNTTQQSGAMHSYIDIVAPGATIGLYLNDALVTRSSGRLTSDLVIPPEPTALQVVLTNTVLNNVIVTVDPLLTLGAAPPTPSFPIWGSPDARYYYLSLGGFVELKWADSSYVGAWHIERTAFTHVAEIVFTEHDVITSVHTLTVDGDYDGAGGDLFIAPDTFLGTIAETAYDEALARTSFTVISSVDPGDWLGEMLFVSGTRASTIVVHRAEASRDADGYITYQDTSVVDELPYRYRIRSQHPMHHELYSPWSRAVIVLAQDLEPPGDIIIKNIGEFGSAAVVDYLTPSDPDYAGVAIYAEYDETLVPVISQHGRVNSLEQVTFDVRAPARFYFKTFDVAGNHQVDGIWRDLTGDDRRRVTITATVDYENNRIEVSVTRVYGNVARVQVWMRLNSSPLVGDIPDNHFLVWDQPSTDAVFSSSIPPINHVWYIAARGIGHDSNPGDITTLQVAVDYDTPATSGIISNVGLTKIESGQITHTHRIAWTYTPAPGGASPPNEELSITQAVGFGTPVELVVLQGNAIYNSPFDASFGPICDTPGPEWRLDCQNTKHEYLVVHRTTGANPRILSSRTLIKYESLTIPL
jgi:hypothetical protein